MITELGCLDVGGNRAQWFKSVFDDLPKKYPAVKSLVFFHSDNDNTTTYKVLNWQIKNDKPTVNAIARAMKGWR
jgi:hypothetical protein